jgi:predicted TIM-barrel fold metal-dependent hydrolase
MMTRRGRFVPSDELHQPARRRLLLGLGTAAMACSFRDVAAQGGGSSSERIVDVHAHYYPPVLKALGAPGPMNAWSLQKHLEEMEAAGVTRSLLSLTTPGIVQRGEQGQKLMRESNEWAAKTSGEHRGKLGFFIYAQPEDPDTALREIEYGFDVLKAQGVGLFTSYGNRWLGDPHFDPVFSELNRRKAIVYVHPTGPACCGQLIPGIFETVIEYGTDTTRAIASYIYRGAARRFPDVKMIWSHSGGTMPFLIERFDGADRSDAAKAAAPEGFRAAASRFFYDIAQASNPVATAALRGVVPVNHIVFGTDYPFRTPLEHVKALQANRVFNRSELSGVYRDNVEQFLPALMV